MTLAETILSRIRQERSGRYGALRLPEEFVAPNYGGRCIVNVPNSVIAVMGGEAPGPSLDREILGTFGSGVRRVVLVICDALGYGMLNPALEANPENGLHALRKAGAAELVPITSVFPSTTVAALTALWSGYTPAQHGLVGFRLFLREYGTRANMISLSPAATQNQGAGQLVRAGLQPEKFVPVPAMPHALEGAGVPVYNLIEQPYANSVLSRVQIRGVKGTVGVVSSSDLWYALRAFLEAHVEERAVYVAYWSGVDGIAHTYGPTSEAVPAEVNNLGYSFEREFLRRLSPEAREGTLFLLTADHGQIDTPASRTVYMGQHPDLRGRLVMEFTGEARAAFLYCRSGEKEAVREYFETQLAEEFFVLDSKEALRAGLFGEGRPMPETEYRIGDLVAVAREGYVLWDKSEPPHERGRHGGLRPEEMLAPLLLARLDG